MVTSTLEELCQIEQIKKFRVTQEHLSSQGNLVLAGKLEVENRKVIYSETSNFSIEGAEKERWFNYSVNKEDIVIFFTKKKVQIGINDGETFWTNKTNLIRLRCSKDLILPSFLHYLLEHKKEELEDLFDDSMDHFFEDLKQFKLTVPDIEKQSEIVLSLGQFDELIDSLKRQLEIREQQFQLFQEKLFSPNPS